MLVKKTNTIQRSKGNFVLCIGKTKQGKTTSIKTLEGNTLVLDYDGGLISLQDEEIDYIDFTSYEKGDNIIKRTKEALLLAEKYDNIVVDTVTEWGKQTLEFHKENSQNKHGQAIYGELSTSFYPWINRLKKLSLSGKNVVLLGQISIREDELGKEYVSVSFDGQQVVPKFIYPKVDAIFFLEKDFKGQRWFVTESSRIEVGVRDPKGALEAKEEANFAKLFKKLKG